MTRLAELVPDEASAYRFLEDQRWKGTPMCPHCASDAVTLLNPDNGVTRRTRTGTMSARRVWQCRDCRKQFSALTGTVMHGTKISVRIWVFVMFEIASNKNGIAPREVERRSVHNPPGSGCSSTRLRACASPIALSLRRDGTVVAMTGQGEEPRRPSPEGDDDADLRVNTDLSFEELVRKVVDPEPPKDAREE